MQDQGSDEDDAEGNSDDDEEKVEGTENPANLNEGEEEERRGWRIV